MKKLHHGKGARSLDRARRPLLIGFSSGARTVLTRRCAMTKCPFLTTLVLASALAAPALPARAVAAPGSPDTFPPATGVIAPYNGGSRGDVPEEYPSASVRGRAGCGGQGSSTLVNGASVPSPATTAAAAPVAGTRSIGAPTMLNGAPVPGSASPTNDPAWCEGTYRPDAGTNFGE